MVKMRRLKRRDALGADAFGTTPTADSIMPEGAGVVDLGEDVDHYDTPPRSTSCGVEQQKLQRAGTMA